MYSHALRGLVVLTVSVPPGVVSSRLFSHTLRGLVVLVVSVTPGLVSSRLFSHALHGLVVLGRDGHRAGHGDREVGLWREIIFDFVLMRVTLQVLCAPPHRTTPVGLPSFPGTAERKKKKKEKHTNKKKKKKKRNKGTENP